MYRGYIKLHRAFIEWEWYKKPNMVHFFVHCLVRANHKTKQFKSITIEPGQFISGRKVMSNETGLSEQNIRTCIKYLKSTKELTTTPTKGIDGEYTVYTLCNWIKYQQKDDANQTSTTTLTTGQPNPNHGLTTNKNDKNDKNDNKSNTVNKFTPPTAIEVLNYCNERDNGIDNERFIDHYQARGWILNNGKKVKDWKACVRTWEKYKKEKEKKDGKSGYSNGVSQEEYERVMQGKQQTIVDVPTYLISS